MEQGRYRLSCQTSLCNAPACPAKQKSMSDTVFFRKTLCAWPHGNRPTLCFWIFMIRSISHGFYVLESSQNITLHYASWWKDSSRLWLHRSRGSAPNWNIVHISYCFFDFCTVNLFHSVRCIWLTLHNCWPHSIFLQHATVGISQSVGQCVTQVPT